MRASIQRLARFAYERPGFTAVLGVAMAEAAMNAAYGWSIGKGYEPFGPWIIAGAMIANEGVKIKTAERLGEALAQGDRVMGGIAGVLLIAVMYISLSSHIGFIGLSRNDATAAREQSRDAGTAVQAQLKTALEQRSKLGALRPQKEIEAEAALECARRSKAYPDGNGPACTKLRAELARADDARRIDAEIAALEGRRATGPAVGTADPQAYVLGWIWNTDEERRKISLAIAFALAMELTTTLGFLLFGHGGREVMDLETLIAQGAISHPGAEHILPFRSEALEPARGDSVAISDVFRAYETWAKRNAKPALSRPAFLRLMEALGVKRTDDRFTGVRLRALFLMQQVGS